MSVDLRSDTVTVPTPGMRAAMAAAEVGDDVYGEDPTVNRLQDAAATRFGTEAALFVPSGTMANQIALKVHTDPGDAVVIGEGAHSALFESGGPGLVAGVLFDVAGRGGLFTADELLAAVHPTVYYYARTRLVCIENTHNNAGGRVFPLEDVRAVAAAAHGRGLRVHLDGARIFNAVAATGVPPRAWAEPVDSLSFCLSKGLGAPVGSVLLGSRDFITEAHRVRKMLGGGMRQAGILAAAGLYALDHHLERLAEDHASARRLAEGLARIPGLEVESPPETNIVMARVPGDAHAFEAAAASRGVLLHAFGPDRVRFVTHLCVTSNDIDRALTALAEAAAA